MAKNDKISLIGGIKQMPYDKSKRNVVQKRYHDKTYFRAQITFHKTTDADLIDYITEQKTKGISPTQLFREWYKEMVK